MSALNEKDEELKTVTEEAREQLKDAINKNESLLEIVRRRDEELREADAREKELADGEREARRRVTELEQRLREFSEKNRELDEIINAKLVERAERYKTQVQEILERNDSHARDALINAEDPVK